LGIDVPRQIINDKPTDKAFVPHRHDGCPDLLLFAVFGTVMGSTTVAAHAALHMCLLDALGPQWGPGATRLQDARPLRACLVGQLPRHPREPAQVGDRDICTEAEAQAVLDEVRHLRRVEAGVQAGRFVHRWPSCRRVGPRRPTTYELTAYGHDGQHAKQQLVAVG
jgi:hypothetical protein